MSTLLKVTMPQPGETITHGTLLRWLISVGSQVKEKQPIAELETEKAVFEYESPFEGKLIELLVKAPATVPVGSPIAVVEVSDEKAKLYELLGLGGGEIVTPAEAGDQKKDEKTWIPASAGMTTNRESANLSPLVRKLIRENNLSSVDLESIQTSDGRITKEDILGYLKDQIIPCSPVRLRIAENMMLSKKTIPHAHTGLSVDLTNLLKYRQKKKASLVSLLFPSLIRAIKKFPIVNAAYLEEQKAIRMHQHIHMGVAVDSGKGLYIPVIHNADAKNFQDFEKEILSKVKRAKENKLKVEDLTGMTFTFNNFGYYGTSFGVQIILPPQTTTLGMGKIEKKPWVVKNKVVIRDIAEFVLAFDHRVMDGRDAGQFLQALKESIENFSEKDLKVKNKKG